MAANEDVAGLLSRLDNLYAQLVEQLTGMVADLSPILSQAAKTRYSANGMNTPLKRWLSNESVSTAVPEGIRPGRSAAAGDGGPAAEAAWAFEVNQNLLHQ